MSSVAWSLEFNGEQRSLEGWGITRPRITFRSLDADELVFDTERRDVLTSATFPTGADLLLRRNGVGWFRGKVVRAGAAGKATKEGETYVVRNAWESLARIVYQQFRCVGGQQQYTPRVTLGQNQFGQKISVGRQVFEIVEYALIRGLLVTSGALPQVIDCWKDEARDITCAGAIRSVLRLMPNAVSWFDYSSGVPVFNVQQNTQLAATTLDAKGADLVADFSEISPRTDLVPAGVTFIYESTTIDATTGKTMVSVSRDTAGVGDIEGSIVALVDLAPGDTAPVGAAANYWAALQATPYEGRITTIEEECSGSLRPGKVLNISNGRADWANMRAVIQIVTEDLFTGTTTAQFGPPEHLSPQDFITQQQIARKRAQPSYFPAVQPCSIADPNGSQGDPENGVAPSTITNPDGGVDAKSKDAIDKFKKVQALKDPASSGLQTVDVSYCDNGTEGTLTVYGHTN